LEVGRVTGGRVTLAEGDVDGIEGRVFWRLRCLMAVKRLGRRGSLCHLGTAWEGMWRRCERAAAAVFNGKPKDAHILFQAADMWSTVLVTVRCMSVCGRKVMSISDQDRGMAAYEKPYPSS